MMRMMRLVLASSLAVALVWSGSLSVSGQIPPYGGVTQYLADLAARRAKTMAALGPETILIAWSAPTRVYSTDVDYEYRQESNLLYLTGIDQEDTILVLVPGAKTRKEMLFTREGEPRREHWEGHTMTPAEVTAASGIATVYPLAAFQPFVDALLGGAGFQQTTEEATAEFGSFFDAVKQSRARLGILERLGGAGGRGGRGGPPSPPPPGSNAAWALEQQTKYPGLTAFGAASILTGQRQVKTPYEQTVLRRSVEISAEAHVEGMKAARPGRWEYEVEAAIEHWYLKNGALSWGYPSIVGSGPNSTVLHYNKSTRQMKDGDLLLVDAAANFQGLTGDITRTYPVNGRFSADQRAIYELVLQAQEAGIAAAKAGVATSAVTQACRAVFAPRAVEARAHHRGGAGRGAERPDRPLVHARAGPRHWPRRARPAGTAARGGIRVRHRARALHPRGGPRSTAEDPREPGLHRESAPGRPALQGHGRAHRRFVPPDRNGPGNALG